MREIKFRAWDRVEKKMIANALMIRNIGLGDGSLLVDADAQKGNELDWLQFTGLLDSKGVEAWEGDVIRFTDIHGKQVLEEIRYNDGSFNVGWFSISGIRGWEIIGNIYENPELIEKL